MCMLDDAEPWTVFDEEKNIRARTEHRCTECRRTIEAGETYRKSRGLMDGRWYTFKTCAHCETIWAWLYAICNGSLFEQVIDDLNEHWINENELRSPWMGRTLVRAKKGWRRADGSLYPVTFPKLGRDYPRLYSINQSVFFRRAEPEDYDKEFARIALVVMGALWWGDWFSIDGVRSLRSNWSQLQLKLDAA